MVHPFDVPLQHKPRQRLKSLLVTIGQLAIERDDLVTWALVYRLVSGRMKDA